MLEDGKRIFEQGASIIPDWKKLTKQQLAEKYIENENSKRLKNAYFSAIACKFWNLIGSNYIKNTMVTSPEDCYDNLMDSLMYSLEKRRWLDEDSNIYNDPNGFDKAVNRRMKSLRLNKYIEAMRQKRRLNYTAVSVESLIEIAGDIFYSEDDDINIDSAKEFAEDVIIDSFNNKKYFRAFLFDIIISSDVFVKNDNKEVEFNYKKTCGFIRNIDERYCKYFSERYIVDYQKVLDASKYVTVLSTDTMNEMIDREFRKSRHDDTIKKMRGK